MNITALKDSGRVLIVVPFYDIDSGLPEFRRHGRSNCSLKYHHWRVYTECASQHVGLDFIYQRYKYYQREITIPKKVAFEYGTKDE